MSVDLHHARSFVVVADLRPAAVSLDEQEA
jgi:hypothetical protein